MRYCYKNDHKVPATLKQSYACKRLMFFLLGIVKNDVLKTRRLRKWFHILILIYFLIKCLKCFLRNEDFQGNCIYYIESLFPL